MRRRTAALGLALAAALAGAGLAAGAGPRADTFSHVEHAALFPTCTTCHAGAAEDDAAIWPSAAGCAACHDGEVEERVEWAPPTAPHPSNLDFTHSRHREEVREEHRDSSVACTVCHSEAGAPRMQVERAVVQQCLDCHGIRTAHLAAPDTACATCHVTLAEAPQIARATVASWEAPPSHEDPDFTFDHGPLAGVPGRPTAVAASCATCHARNFCIECHVDAPEQPVIQALATDERSLAMEAELREPPSHREPGFVEETHGELAEQAPQQCATCHTKESCLACHAGEAPAPVARLASAGAGRGAGAATTRTRPPSHGGDFTETHGRIAASRPTSCTTCHVRESCLDCHRPGVSASATGDYHPRNFLARHPAAAYSRETECADCHNQAQFCTACHVESGLGADGPLRGGFHDGARFFVVGHGQAARQSLESCTSCHAERDCLTCHSALGGRRFNPHGPGFDASRLRRRNPEMCTACHGQAIPGES